MLVVQCLLCTLVIISVTAAPAVPGTGKQDFHQRKPKRNLTYSDDSLNVEWDCYYCTEKYYSDRNYFQSECYSKNTGGERIIQHDGLVYKPWCRKASGIGFIRNCTLPQLIGGWHNCSENAKVYKTCEVRCNPGYSPVQRVVECQEDGTFDKPVQCQPVECTLTLLVNGRIDCPRNKSKNSTCEVRCNPGYSPVQRVVECQEDGTFDKPVQCQPVGVSLSTVSVILIIVFSVIGVGVGVGVVIFFICRRQQADDEAAMSSVSTSTSSLEKSKLSHNDGTKTALPELISAQRESHEIEALQAPLLQDSSEEIPPQPLQEEHRSSTTPLLQDSLSKEMHDQKSTSSKRLPPYSSFPDPPPSYHTLSNSMDSITSASSHQNDLGTGMHTIADDPDETHLKACMQASRSENAEANFHSDFGQSETIDDLADADLCEVLLEYVPSQHKKEFDELKHQTDVSTKRVTEQSIDGAVVAILNKPKSYTDWVIGQCSNGVNLRVTPFSIFYDEMIHAGKKIGHLVSYFSQQRSQRLDVVRILQQIHPKCTFCSRFHSK